MTIPFLQVVALAVLLPASALAQDLTAYGNFQHMIHTGETAGIVDLAEVPASPGHWGVGALAGLKGEILLYDGQLLISRVHEGKTRIMPASNGERAVLFASGEVTQWHMVALPETMDSMALSTFIEGQAEALGLSPDQGFPLRLPGTFTSLVWHVVTGNAPGGHDQKAAHGQASGHANSASGMKSYDQPGALGEIVGIYTGSTLEGIASHPGERLHLHYIDKNKTVSGHVDEISIPAGTTLMLPVAMQNHTAGMNHSNTDHQATMSHDDASPEPAMNHQTTAGQTAPQQGGQSAFAAIQEIVDIISNDPGTDWSHVDIEALRLHLIDMDQVTLRANVTADEVPNGARFTATSADPAVATSIKNMVLAHAATMDGVEGWHFNAEEIDAGAVLTVAGAESDVAKIRALGFIGIMTVGMHHQSHHLALASGSNPHDH